MRWLIVWGCWNQKDGRLMHHVVDEFEGELAIFIKYLGGFPGEAVITEAKRSLPKTVKIIYAPLSFNRLPIS